MSVVILVAFGLIYSALRIWLYSFGPDSEDIPIPLVILATTITSLNFLHYYLDRILFRMRDSTTRENIAPLII